MQTINIDNKFSQFQEHWTPKIIAELNGQQVKLAKIQGDFVWHNHAQEDEMFLIFKMSSESSRRVVNILFILATDYILVLMFTSF